MDFAKREDRIGKYLRPFLNDYIFDELSDSYLQKTGLADVLSGVPVPVRKDEINNITTLSIAKAMAFVIGCDPGFKYAQNYLDFILRVSDKSFAKALVADGMDGAQKRDYDYACVKFRAAMMVDPDNVDALYCYGRALRDAYETVAAGAAMGGFGAEAGGEADREAAGLRSGTDAGREATGPFRLGAAAEEDFIARFKIESIEAFEEVTLRRPDFAEAYYFLGYGYINLGLYVKAKLTWEEFVELTDDEEKKTEIRQLLDRLDDPVRIEEGYNKIISGRYEEGLAILSQYEDSRYEDWWPLWYYLGVAAMELGRPEEAVEDYKKALVLSPSNRETMKEMVRAYEALGDEAMAAKYRKKIVLVEENAEKDRLEAMGARGRTLS